MGELAPEPVSRAVAPAAVVGFAMTVIRRGGVYPLPWRRVPRYLGWCTGGDQPRPYGGIGPWPRWICRPSQSAILLILSKKISSRLRVFA